MSDVFIIDLFIFESTKILPYFAASNQHFTGMPECTKHMILHTLHVFYIHNKNNVQPFNIHVCYNISNFSFLKFVCK